MKRYQVLLQQIMRDGTDQMNRTGVSARSISGAMLKFDLRDGFPAVTTKKLAWNAVKGELLGFIRGYDNAEQFRALGCNIWDQNANENKQWLDNPCRKGTDDLGRIYGVQWRDWDGHLDQLGEAIRTIITDPANRRIIISAWRPDEFYQMALPPCHVLYQFIVNVEQGRLDMCMYQRSCDMFLGVPFNIASASLLLSIAARLTGYKAGIFTHFLADAHIYENHFNQVNELLSREPRPLPELVIDSSVATAWRNTDINAALLSIEPEHLTLAAYVHHDAIKAPMAV